MQYTRIEDALARLARDPKPGGRFQGTAGVFERILKDDHLTASQKAKAIAKVIEDRL